MARKRFVSSEISTDKKIAMLAEENPTVALMWPWFTTAFDDWGRMGADPFEVKLTLFPAFPFTSKDIEEAIRKFDEYDLAYLYEVDGKQYLSINPNKWYKYQTYISSKRQQQDNSKYPAPPNPPWENQRDSQINTVDEEENQDENDISKKVAENLQTSQKIVPSLSLSLSKDSSGGGNNARAREEKTNNEKFGRAYRAVEEHFFQSLNSVQTDKLDGFVSKGIEPELVERAVRITKEKGKDISYLWGILARCESSGVYTLKAFEEKELERRSRDGPKVSNHRGHDERSSRENQDESGKGYVDDYPGLINKVSMS